MKIRKCIEQLNKVGSHIVHCNNGARIYLFVGEQDYSYSKRINGKEVFRHIHCLVSERDKAIKIPEIEKYSLIYSSGDDYILPERIMNLLINCNGGIDEYLTISAPYYMMVDTMSMMEDMEWLE